MAIALVAIAVCAGAEEAGKVWTRGSAGAFSLQVSLQGFRNHADYCVDQMPALESDFNGLLKDLEGRMQSIAAGVFATGAFGNMWDKPVPAEINLAFQDSYHDSRHNLELQDAATACPKVLRKLSAMDDGALRSGLEQVLVAVRNMLRNLEL